MHFFIHRCALIQNSGIKPDAQIVVDKSDFPSLCTLNKTLMWSL